jgi:hypothetical protein
VAAVSNQLIPCSIAYSMTARCPSRSSPTSNVDAGLAEQAILHGR